METKCQYRNKPNWAASGVFYNNTKENDKSIEAAFKNTWVNDIIKTKEFRRLKGVSFLGAVDPWLIDKVDEDASFSRYYHSLGVASLATLIIELDDDFPEQEKRLFVACALLHDLGHGPLSHSIEGVFKERFNVDHHIQTLSHFENNKKSSRLKEALCDNGVNYSDVKYFLNGGQGAYFCKYFHGPFNVDTLDGVYRAFAVTNSSPEFSLLTTVKASILSLSQKKNTEVLDRFWDMKGLVYNSILYDGLGRVADEAAKSAVYEDISKLAPEHFLLKDSELFDVFPAMRSMIVENIMEAWGSKYKSFMESYRKRVFGKDDSVCIDGHGDLKLRYNQKKLDWVYRQNDLFDFNFSQESEYCSQMELFYYGPKVESLS